MRKAGVFLVLLLTVLLSGCRQTPDWQEQYELGTKYLERKMYEEAIEAFSEAIKIEQGNPEVYAARGSAYIHSGETEAHLKAAQADYEKAVSLDGSYARDYLGLADIHIRKKEYDKALEVLNQGLEKTGDDTGISDKIAEIQSGNIKDSEDNERKFSSYDAEGNLIWYHEYFYDENGEKCRVVAYDGAGVQTDEMEVAYDEQGHLTDTFGYIEKDGTLYKIVHEYDDSGNRAKTDRYDSDGALDSYKTYEYDEKGNLVQEQYFDSSENLQAYFVYEYDENDRIKKHSQYGADKKLRSYWVFEIDSDGQRTKDSFYDGDGALECYYVYHYDDDGNLVEREEFIAE